jgi:hypothetical protein
MAEWEDILSGMGDFSSYTLEASPAMAYFSAAPFQGTSAPAQRQYWGSQYGNISNEYAGALGTALRTGGQAPTFVDFLKETPWTERYTSLSPSLRPGGSFRRFAPQTRYAYR